MTEKSSTPKVEMINTGFTVAHALGEKIIGSGDFFLSHIDIRVDEQEKYISPVPIPKMEDDTHVLVCSIDGLNEWIKIFGDCTVLDDSQITEMYFATGLSWLELALLGRSAKLERNFVDDTDPRGIAMQRAAKIQMEFLNKERLIQQADHLGKIGVKGVIECVENMPDRDLVVINRYRYGLGVAIDYLELDKKKRTTLNEELFASLKHGISQYKEGMFDLIIQFADDELAGIITEDAFEKEFPLLTFAAAIPMNVSYINSRD